jgi:hypothetical protein
MGRGAAENVTEAAFDWLGLQGQLLLLVYSQLSYHDRQPPCLSGLARIVFSRLY